MDEIEKPWHDAQYMANLYSDEAIRSDEDAACYFRLKGFDVSRRTVTDARNALGIPAKSKGSFIQIERDAFDDQEVDPQKVWDAVIELQNQLRKKNTAKKDVHVNFETNEPIGFFFMGDLHVGDVGTDHAALLRDIELIQKTEGLYGSMGGDYINNFILGGKKIKNHEVLPVEAAWDLTADVFERLRESLLMILLGNHDEWTDVAAEIDKVSEIVAKIGVPYGKHGSNLHLGFPDGQQYKIRLRHKYMFNSSQNLLSSVKQMYRWDDPFDIGVLHHLHTPGIEMFPAPERGMCWAIRPGSYKVEDDYSYALGYSTNGFGMSRTFGTEQSCRYSVPVAILYPGERRIHVAPTIKDGVDYLSYAREKYKEENNG
jgi:hypothetical protein